MMSSCNLPGNEQQMIRLNWVYVRRNAKTGKMTEKDLTSSSHLYNELLQKCSDFDF